MPSADIVAIGRGSGLATVSPMGVDLNHTVIGSLDAETSARWLAELLGLPEPTELFPFWQVVTDNGVGLDFISGDRNVIPRHYAFLVSEDDFTAIYARITERRMDHWADPRQTRPGVINTNDGGRGVYFSSNDGHSLEIITVPYGGWPAGDTAT